MDKPLPRSGEARSRDRTVTDQPAPGAAPNRRSDVVAAAAYESVAPPGRRTPALLVALAAVGVIAVALATKSGTAPPSAPGATEPSSTSAAVPVASPGGAPVATPGLAAAPDEPPPRNALAVPYPTYPAIPVRPGTIWLDPGGSAPISLSLDLPAGWVQRLPNLYSRALDSGVPLSIGAWRIAQVNTFPCRWSAAVFADPGLLDTAAGQAQALSSWWGQQPDEPSLTNSPIAPLANDPAQTSIGGYPAWSVDVLVPTGFDLAQCDAAQLVLWSGADGTVRYAFGPGELNRLWVVAIPSGPIVVDEGLPLTASTAQQAELDAILHSLTITSLVR